MPHLLPQNRGILGSIYVNGNAKELHDILVSQYTNEYIISVLRVGDNPTTKHVRGSNFVHSGVADGTKENQAIIFCVLDNLVKVQQVSNPKCQYYFKLEGIIRLCLDQFSLRNRMISYKKIKDKVIFGMIALFLATAFGVCFWKLLNSIGFQPRY